jgi:hypothetical protein
LNKFNEGYRIAIHKAIDVQNNSCHWPMDYEFYLTVPSPTNA